MEATLASPLTSAELCRRNGWTPGTYLRSWSESHGTHVNIQLTAIGAGQVLIRSVNPLTGQPTGCRTDDQPITDDARCQTTHQPHNPTQA